MNHSIDLDPESNRRADSESNQNNEARYLEFIELLIDKSIKRLQRRSYRPKIQDALRAIRLKHKVFKDSESEKAFWDQIEEIRQEELPKLYPESKPEPLDLESQIINTIKGLKYQVVNGTLTVKTITDHFNYRKSNEGRLSYSRLGRLLSGMGFRKTRTSNGCSAIFWDDQLLSNQSPGVPESCQKDPAEDSPTLPTDSSLPKEKVSTSSNSSVSNVRNFLPDNGLEEK